MMMQLTKFSFHFHLSLQIIKCLRLVTFCNAVHTPWPTIYTLCECERLLFGFHSEVETLTVSGKFCNHRFVSVLCSMKVVFKYNPHNPWMYNLTADTVGSTLMYKVYMFRL